jgi:hypothetical protein
MLSLPSFQPVSPLFREQSSSRAVARLIAFLAFFSIASRVFSSRVIACCNFLSAAVRYR